MKCKVEGCGAEEKYKRPQLCLRHYTQIKRHGRITNVGKYEITPEHRANQSRAWHKANPEGTSTAKGYKWTEEQLVAHKERSKGRTFNTGRTHFKKGVPSWNTGKKAWMSDEHKEAVRIANTGRPGWNAGKEWPEMKGDKNPNWSGDSIKYRGLHRWVESKLGQPDTCQHCKTTGLTGHKIHWANKSHLYKRDVTDWLRLCAQCHADYDTNKLSLSKIGG